MASGKRYYSYSREDRRLLDEGAFKKSFRKKGLKILSFELVPCTQLPAEADKNTLITYEPQIKHANQCDGYHNYFFKWCHDFTNYSGRTQSWKQCRFLLFDEKQEA